MVRELRTHLREGDRIGVVDDQGVEVEFLGGHLEFVAARPGHHHPMSGVAEAFSDRASQLRIAAGDQHLHRSDLLVFVLERRTRHWNRGTPWVGAGNCRAGRHREK